MLPEHFFRQSPDFVKGLHEQLQAELTRLYQADDSPLFGYLKANFSKISSEEIYKFEMVTAFRDIFNRHLLREDHDFVAGQKQQLLESQARVEDQVFGALSGDNKDLKRDLAASKPDAQLKDDELFVDYFQLVRKIHSPFRRLANEIDSVVESYVREIQAAQRRAFFEELLPEILDVEYHFDLNKKFDYLKLVEDGYQVDFFKISKVLLVGYDYEIAGALQTYLTFKVLDFDDRLRLVRI